MSEHLLADAVGARANTRVSLERRLRAVDAQLAATEHAPVSFLLKRKFLLGERTDLAKRLRDLDQLPLFADAREMFP